MGGYLLRNQLEYGQTYQPQALTVQTNEIRNWQVLVSNINRNLALHADLPGLNTESWLRDYLDELHEDLGLAINDPRTTVDGVFYIPENSAFEQASGNPLHLLIFVLSLVAVAGIVILGKENPSVLIYAAMLIVSMLLYCLIFKWSPTGGRTQLTYFFMFGPVAAVFLDKLEKYQVEGILAAILLILAIPWIF